MLRLYCNIFLPTAIFTLAKGLHVLPIMHYDHHVPEMSMNSDICSIPNNQQNPEDFPHVGKRSTCCKVLTVETPSIKVKINADNLRLQWAQAQRTWTGEKDQDAHCILRVLFMADIYTHSALNHFKYVYVYLFPLHMGLIFTFPKHTLTHTHTHLCAVLPLKV